MNETYYPADFTLEQWLELRKGWRNRAGEIAYWNRAQQSALGPNLKSPHLKNPGA